MRIAVVIPAYNEACAIAQVLAELKSFGYALIVVDDGSTDQTAKLARLAGAQVLSHPFNLGQGAALATGLAYALQEDYQVVVTFDADGQHQASDLPQLLAPILAHQVEVVLGSRYLGQAINQPLARKIVQRLAVLFTRLTCGLKITDTHNGLRAFSAAAIKKMQLTENGMAHASEILEQLAKLKLSYCECPVRIRYTPYSLHKGQNNLAAFKILGDLIWRSLK